MPQVIIKLLPGKLDIQKQRLSKAITQGVVDVLSRGEDAGSVASEEFEPGD